jgi:hypothetical protein
VGDALSLGKLVIGLTLGGRAVFAIKTTEKECAEGCAPLLSGLWVSYRCWFLPRAIETKQMVSLLVAAFFLLLPRESECGVADDFVKTHSIERRFFFSCGTFIANLLPQTQPAKNCHKKTSSFLLATFCAHPVKPRASLRSSLPTYRNDVYITSLYKSIHL